MESEQNKIGDEEWLMKAKISPEWKLHGGRWAAPQHYTCSYMAMFPPQLPHYFIQKFTDEGDVILDPFSGRGTTPVQAISQNRIGIGNDLNDLAYALTKGKIANPNLDEIIERLQLLKRNYEKTTYQDFSEVPDKIKMIYHNNTLGQLLYLKEKLQWKENDIDSFIVMVLMGAMHGSSAGFLSVSMPNTFSMGWKYVENYIQKHNLKKPDRDVFEVLEKRCKRFLNKGKLPGSGIALFGDSKNLVKNNQDILKPGTIDLIFSSPPYLKVIKYGLYNWIRLWWLVGSHEGVDDRLDDTHDLKGYLNFMKEIMKEMIPLINPEKGLICWVIGDVTKKGKASEETINLAKELANISKDIEGINSNGVKSKYKILGIIDDEIKDMDKVTKIWNSVDLEEDKSGKATSIDRILIMCLDSCDYMKMKIKSNSHISWNPITEKKSYKS